jgi:predicted ribosomally synthesized peptide with SipW-like signal peptide
MKKEISAIVTAIALVALIAVGSTLAFFTGKGEVNNVITVGNVGISLTEPNFKDSGIVVPGQTVVKDPTVTNTGGNTVYVRCRLEITGLETESAEVTAKRNTDLLEGIAFGDEKSSGPSSNWALSEDNYYYYQGKLAPTENVRFFNSVTIPKGWGNELANRQFHINVTAEAIQADNFAPSKDGTGRITGWNYSAAAGGKAVTVK